MRYLLTCSFFFGCQIHQALLPSPGSRFLFSAHPTDDTTVLLLSSDTNNTFPSSSFPNQLSMLSLQYNTHDIPSPIYKNLPAFLLHELCNFPLLPPVETTDKRIASHAETEHKLQHVIIITPALFSPSPFLVTRSNTVSLSLSLSRRPSEKASYLICLEAEKDDLLREKIQEKSEHLQKCPFHHSFCYKIFERHQGNRCKYKIPRAVVVEVGRRRRRRRRESSPRPCMLLLAVQVERGLRTRDM
jgi:hypothetical protein